jgi:hypothetical protein
MTDRNVAEDLVASAREELQRMLGSEPEPELDGEFDWDAVARVAADMKRALAGSRPPAEFLEVSNILARLEIALAAAFDAGLWSPRSPEA